MCIIRTNCRISLLWTILPRITRIKRHSLLTRCDKIAKKKLFSALFRVCKWFTRTSITRLTRINSCQCNLHHAISAGLDSYELTRLHWYKLIPVSVCATQKCSVLVSLKDIWKFRIQMRRNAMIECTTTCNSIQCMNCPSLHWRKWPRHAGEAMCSVHQTDTTFVIPTISKRIDRNASCHMNIGSYLIRLNEHGR